MTKKTSITLGKSLDITQAGSISIRLKSSLQKSPNIELKASAIEKADTAGLQLIVSLKNEVEISGGSITWNNPSKALLNSAEFLGLFEHIGLHY